MVKALRLRFYVLCFAFCCSSCLVAQERMVWEGSSRDGSYHATLTVTVYGEYQQYEAFATLYDAEMQQLWTREYAVGTMESLWVTDSGTIVTVGCDPEHDGNEVTVNEITQWTARTYRVAVEAPEFDSLQVMGMGDGCAVVRATVNDTQRFVAAVDTGGTVRWMRWMEEEGEYYVFRDSVTLVIGMEEGNQIDRILGRKRWVMYSIDNEGNEVRKEVKKPLLYELSSVEEQRDGTLLLMWKRGGKVKTTVVGEEN